MRDVSRATNPAAHYNLEDDTVDQATRTELEAAAFRRLVAHLQKRKDVQNIDLMTLGGFCRNCFSKWYKTAADDLGVELDMADAQHAIYGMSYADWKANHQPEATPEQLAAYEKAFSNRAK